MIFYVIKLLIDEKKTRSNCLNNKKSLKLNNPKKCFRFSAKRDYSSSSVL